MTRDEAIRDRDKAIAREQAMRDAMAEAERLLTDALNLRAWSPVHTAREALRAAVKS